jgi:hypothetical protein
MKKWKDRRENFTSSRFQFLRVDNINNDPLFFLNKKSRLAVT